MLCHVSHATHYKYWNTIWFIEQTIKKNNRWTFIGTIEADTKYRWIRLYQCQLCTGKFNIHSYVYWYWFNFAQKIKGIHSDREYIACQAPLRDTLDDFYRMILEHKVPIVVNLLERENPSYFPSFVGDDDQMERKIYLPDATEEVQLLNMMARNNEHDHDNQINGLINEQMIKRIQIKLHQVEQRECYQIKQIHFINNDSIIHRVSQFHYNKWIDFGTPDNVKSLIELIHDVRTFISINSQNMMIRNAPIVVHCK